VLIGLHVSDFAWPGGSRSIGPTLSRVLTRAEQAGIHSFWPMDHFFPIPVFGQPDDPMLEVYATLAWAAGLTQRMQLGALVTGVPYRHPGVLLKALTTIDVLSGGRAWLGIGAAWNESEAAALGIPFPPLRERFERLEEALQVAHRMFDGDARPFDGRHYRLDRPLNVPSPVRRPPILVGGSGERRTLRLVAQYADACNLFELLGVAGIRHKLEVLARHCADVGRPYDDIIKTTFGQIGPLDVGQTADRLGTLAELGVDLALVDLPDAMDDSVFDFLAAVVEQARSLGRPTPERLIAAS
jgi:F420-dependent oxidoreductase-like protein